LFQILAGTPVAFSNRRATSGEIQFPPASTRERRCRVIRCVEEVDPRRSRRMLKIYASYYNEVRTRLKLEKDAPKFRRSQRFGHIIAVPILGGLQIKYVRV
jgi:hypothetical protein